MIADKLADIHTQIEIAAQKVKRDSSSIKLVAVSKTYSEADVQQAIDAGQFSFGENRVQEATEKFPALKIKYSNLKLHLIGPLQTNKVKDAVALFDVIHTLDRDALAEKLASELQKTKKPVELFIQINTGEEAQKSGLPPHDADQFIHRCLNEYHLPVTGLMCIPPAADVRPYLHFALLGEIARCHKLKNLSMGMSADFETAINYGATHVRIGSAIFGAR